MKIILLAVALSIGTTAAVAQGRRPSTTEMSCRSANALIMERGAIVIGTGGDTYDRFVRDQSFCPKGLTTVAGFAPAGDNPQCFVGYRCVDISKDISR